MFASPFREDLQGAPGPAAEAAAKALTRNPRDAAAQFDACLAALTAGEPKRALALLQPSLQLPRVTSTLSVWATRLDGNWYPGDVAAEAEMDPSAAEGQPNLGVPLEEFVEYVTHNGPTGLFTIRALIDGAVREDATTGAQQAFLEGWAKLDALSKYAVANNLTGVAAWVLVAGVDLAHRAGRPVDEQLGAARQHLHDINDTGHLAWSYLVEGDWYLTPGSSPEALGWDLAPQPHPARVHPDRPRATECYAQVAALAGSKGDAPRLSAALDLRRSMLASAEGDHASSRQYLSQASAGFLVAGDTASYHLVAMHDLVADIDAGELSGHALDLGGGWHVPAEGPLAEALAWATTVGSRSWCAGLGRLLERCGDYWTGCGDAARSRIAYLAALQLTSVDPSIPTQSLMATVAAAEARSSLVTNPLLRLERAYGPVLSDTSTADEFVFSVKLQAAMLLVSSLRDRARGPAALAAAARMDVVKQQLGSAAAALRATLPPPPGPVPTTMSELSDTRLGLLGGGSLDALENRAPQSLILMQHMLLREADREVESAGVLAALTRAQVAQRTGQPSQAAAWFDDAINRAHSPSVTAFLLPLTLILAGRRGEARAALADRAGELPDEVLLTLGLAAKDYQMAADATGRMSAAGFVPRRWQDLASAAELQLALNNPETAQQLGQQALEEFEDSVRLLLRDPDRLEACDQPNVASMYCALAATHLARNDPPSVAEIDASFDAAERIRSLTSDADTGDVAADTKDAWQHAAAEYAAHAARLLAGLATATTDEQLSRFAALDRLDADLAAAEHRLDVEDPGVLLRRSATPRQAHASQIRKVLPDGTLLLEYLADGDSLLAWAMTMDDARAERQSIRFRDLAMLVRTFHAACADGHAPDHTQLTDLLLDPFADLISASTRILVVPFGPLNLLPFHALPTAGGQLGLTRVVSYLQRATSLVERKRKMDALTSHTHPLIVGDPGFDPTARGSLDRLPGSRCEAAHVAEILAVPADRVLVDSTATEAAMHLLLPGCDLLHVSSHGQLDELSPFSSALILAGRDELTVADIAGLRLDIDLAVLTGCDTGRGTATLGGDLVGFTRSLLRSGVQRAVVSLWPVDDWAAPLVMSQFYRELAGGVAPAHALAAAQRTIHSMSAEAMRAAYAALGGDISADLSQRRGPNLDPDLLDEEPLPEPLGGDAERYWAPFVLVE